MNRELIISLMCASLLIAGVLPGSSEDELAGSIREQARRRLLEETETDHEQAQERVNSLRRAAGLAPIESSSIEGALFYTSFLQWKGIRRELDEAIHRLVQVKSMSPDERHLMIGIMTPRTENLDLVPYKEGDDEWLVKAIGAECGELEKRLSIQALALGITNMNVDVSDAVAEQIGDAQRVLWSSETSLNKLREAETNAQPDG